MTRSRPRLSTVILPTAPWSKARERWRRAEELGFHAAYTYDHLSWRRLEDRPWFATVPTLAAAALETSAIRLGTLVTSPNFRHPVPLAKDLLGLDDLSSGRLTVGIGSGGLGNDATVLGSDAWGVAERTGRFEDFVGLLDQLLREPVTTASGGYYSASEARMLPGMVQKPRPPFYIAAAGQRGFRLAATHAQGWVTIGLSEDSTATCFDNVSNHLAGLVRACEDAGRDAADLDKVLLDGLNDEQPLTSLDAFVDWAGRYGELGITELVIHWPEPDSIYDCDTALFERIATEGLTQV